jgi:hypothetical protein
VSGFGFAFGFALNDRVGGGDRRLGSPRLPEHSAGWEAEPEAG